MRSSPPFSSAADGAAPGGSARREAPGREAAARLVAARAGVRTVLTRQHVPYPFHVTRPFRLDRERDDLATLYLQSASGGLYAGDRLALAVEAGEGAALHVTTQAATVVRDCRGAGARQAFTLAAGPASFLALISDPCVLFPGAALELATHATADETAVLLLADGFAVHDPRDRGAAFEQLRLATTIARPDGRRLMLDRGAVTGREVVADRGPLGGHHAAGTFVAVAPAERLAAPAALEAAADAAGCLAGASPLAGGTGVAVRLLAPDGGYLTRGIEALFEAAAQAALGFRPARRRK